jgi:hypothetical protein
MRELLATFDIKIPTDKLKQLDKGVDSAAKQMREFAKVFAAGEIVSGLRSFGQELIGTATAIDDVAAQLGLGTTELQQWQLAATLSGSSAEDLGAAVRTLQKNTGAAGEEGGKVAGVFADLGVQLTDASGNARSTADIMRDTGLAIAKLESPAARTKASMEAFGKAGAKLGPMFEGGAEGLDALLGELETLGGGLSEDAIKQIGGFDDAMVRWDTTLLSVKASIATQVFPALTKLAGQVREGVQAFAQGEGGANRMRAVLVTLGVAGAVAGASMIAPWIPMAVGIGIAVLLIEDLIVAFNGGDSAAGALLDRLLGEGGGDSVFKQIKEDVEALRKKLDETPGSANKVGEAFSTVGASITRLFADEIPQGVQDAFDAVANGTADGAQKFIVGFVETIKSSVLGLPIYFGMIGVQAVQKMFASLKSGAITSKDELIALMKEVGEGITAALANAVRFPELSLPGSGPRGDLVNPAGGGGGGGGGSIIPSLLGGGLLTGVQLLGATNTSNRTLNQTNTIYVDGGRDVKNEVSAGLRDFSDSVLADAEPVIG